MTDGLAGVVAPVAAAHALGGVGALVAGVAQGEVQVAAAALGDDIAAVLLALGDHALALVGAPPEAA